MRTVIFCLIALACIANGCGSDESNPSTPGNDGGQPEDGATVLDAGDAGGPHDGGDAADSGDAQTIQRGCALPIPACYTVYAHSVDTLYYLDQTTKALVTVGAFQAPAPDGGPGSDPITDLAVTPDDAIWVVSPTALYAADPNNGHVTLVGHIATCGSGNAALTADRAGHLFLGDFNGAICSLDPTTMPPTVGAPVAMTGGFALAGDLAVVGDGTAFATIVTLAMPSTKKSNTLATLDLSNGRTTPAPSATGFPELYGVAYGGGQVLAFSHDGSGRAVSIEPTTGGGLLYARLTDPSSHAAVTFAGAGVNPLVSR